VSAGAGGSGLGGEVGVGSSGALEFEQAFEDANGGVEGGDAGIRGVAVPAAVGELLGKEAAGERARGVAEIRTEREDAAVDAWLLFALEEGVAAGFATVRRGDLAVGGLKAEIEATQVPAAGLVVPAQVGFRAGERGLDGGAGGIDAGGAQEQEGEKG
jgi:hypothetical protein